MGIASNSLCLVLKIYNIQKSAQQFNSGECCQTRYPENPPDTEYNVFLSIQLSSYENKGLGEKKGVQNQPMSSLML